MTEVVEQNPVTRRFLDTKSPEFQLLANFENYLKQILINKLLPEDGFLFYQNMMNRFSTVFSWLKCISMVRQQSVDFPFKGIKFIFLKKRLALLKVGFISVQFSRHLLLVIDLASLISYSTVKLIIFVISSIFVCLRSKNVERICGKILLAIIDHS